MNAGDMVTMLESECASDLLEWLDELACVLVVCWIVVARVLKCIGVLLCFMPSVVAVGGMDECMEVDEPACMYMNLMYGRMQTFFCFEFV